MASATPAADGIAQTPLVPAGEARGRRASSRTLVAAVISIAGIAISITMWHGLEVNDSDLQANAIRGEAQAVQREFVTSVESQSRALNRMAMRWEAEGGTPRARWEADASAHLLDQPAYQAIEWVDPTFRVRWIVPLEGNEAAQDLDLAFEERRWVALLESKETRKRIVTRPVDPAQGGKGFMVYYPLYRGDDFDGFLLGVYRFDRLFETIFGEEPSSDFALAVSDGPELVYISPRADTSLKDDWGETVSLDLLGLPLQAVVWPTASYLAAQESTLHEGALALGLFLTAVLVICAYAAQTALIRGRELAEANRLLAIDITEHQRIEALCGSSIE